MKLKVDEERLSFTEAFCSRAAQRLNNVLKRRYPQQHRLFRYTGSQLAETFSRCKGRCVYCGISLTMAAGEGNTPYFSFYVPIKYGGHLAKENLIVTCYVCRVDINPTPRPLTRVSGVNRIPDLIEQLVLLVRKRAIAEKANEGQAFLDLNRDIEALKRDIDVALEELTILQRYSAPVEPEQKRPHRRPVDIMDTIGSVIASIADVAKEDYDGEAIEKTPQKDELTGHIEQIETFKRYKVIRIGNDNQSDLPEVEPSEE